MTRLFAPPGSLDELTRRFDELDDFIRSNPFNNAAVSGTMRLTDTGQVVSGQTRMTSAGLWLPFGGQSTSVAAWMRSQETTNARMQTGIDRAQARADDAYAEQAKKPTQAYVDARDANVRSDARAAQSTANTALSEQAKKPTQAYVDARDANVRSDARAAQSTANSGLSEARGARGRADAAYSLAQGRATQRMVNDLYDMVQALWRRVDAIDGSKPMPPRPPHG